MNDLLNIDDVFVKIDDSQVADISKTLNMVEKELNKFTLSGDDEELLEQITDLNNVVLSRELLEKLLTYSIAYRHLLSQNIHDRDLKKLR